MLTNTVIRVLAPVAAVAATLASTPAHAAPQGAIRPHAAVASPTEARAAAEGSYNILISHRALFVADFCLLSTTSGNKRAACSGNKALGTDFRDRAAINLNVDCWKSLDHYKSGAPGERVYG